MSVTRDEHSGEADDDSSFLDQVLNKLYDFGDGKNKRLKKSRKRKNSAKDDMNDTEENTDTVCHNTDSEQLVTNTTVCENMQSGAEQSSVEVVTFIDPLKKNKLSKPVEPRQKVPDVKENKKKGSDEKLTIEKARFEVHKFGLTGYHKQQQRVFEQDRAVMLGARPPKKEYVNYKAYQEIIKEQKIKAKEEAKSEPHKKKRKDGKSRFEKRKSSSGGDIGGQVGRFKDGMLVLSSKDIQKLKVKVRK
ncbi:uncharacterized protein C1orf131 homolog [Labeo rohita]|uniref:uncharacterized protein C1orf131 homolog n=1 Tax=Labeo rohita TaxID=84645 RepID=UPI0021E2725E|nr:uncharacterized protein C1orf131 homolog [Labeo rohita]